MAASPSFAWGLAPPDGRPTSDGEDAAWRERVRSVAPAGGEDERLAWDAWRRCRLDTDPSSVPRLLLDELVTRLSLRLAPGDVRGSRAGRTLTYRRPLAQVHEARTSPETPPHHWLVNLEACFPYDSPAFLARCARVVALLDARHPAASSVLFMRDAGVVPDDAVASRVAPSNARGDELLVAR